MAGAAPLFLPLSDLCFDRIPFPMAKSNRGRKAAAERLGLTGDAPSNSRDTRGRSEIDDYLDLASRPPGGSRRPGKKPAARTAPARRGKLPSDGTILGTLMMRALRWVVRVALFFLVASIATAVLYRFVNPPITPLMLIRPLESLGEGRMVGVDKNWVSIDRIDPVLLRSVIASEDSRFFIHNGVDWEAVKQAEKRNEKAKGKKVWGASTITMQCARNVFLWQGRNYVRKGLEVYFTYLMEGFWSKRRILEVYLNVIEWGDGIYGVEAAAHHYFGVAAADLTPRQAALLAAVLPNPRRFDAARPNAYVNGRAATIQARAPLVDLEDIAVAPAKATKERKGR